MNDLIDFLALGAVVVIVALVLYWASRGRPAYWDDPR